MVTLLGDRERQVEKGRSSHKLGGCLPHIPLCPLSEKIHFAFLEGSWWSYSFPNGMSSAQQKVSRREKTQPRTGRGGDKNFSSCARIWKPQELGIQRKKAWLTDFPSHALRSQSSHQGRASPRCLLGVKPHSFIWFLTVGCIHLTY